MEPVDPALVEQKLRILTVLCGALLSSLVIYVVIGIAVTGAGTRLAPELPAVVPWALAAAGVLTITAGETVSRMVLGQRLRGATGPAQRLEAAQQAAILGQALREWAGVAGLIATLLTGSLVWCGALCAAAAVAILGAWPRRERLAAIAAGGPPPIG